MLLVDTSVLVDFFRGRHNRQCLQFKKILEQEIPFGITSYSLQEVLQGAKSETEYETLLEYLRTQRYFHPKDSIESFAEAARIYFALRKKGITVASTIDCLIAQIAIDHDLFLLHRDSDFDKIATLVPLKSYR